MPGNECVRLGNIRNLITLGVKAISPVSVHRAQSIAGRRLFVLSTRTRYILNQLMERVEGSSVHQSHKIHTLL